MQITKSAMKDIKELDLLSENDVDTIYIIPATEALPDEIEAIKQTENDISNGDVIDFDSVDWDS